MSTFNVSFLKSVFSDLISQEFNSEVEKLRIEYDGKYDHRAQMGLNSELDRDRLEDEWRFKFIKLEKRRNWLWYLMSTEKFVELDDHFNTDYTFSDLDLRLRTQYDIYKKSRDNNFKYINRKSSFVHFSKSPLEVEGDDSVDITFADDYSFVPNTYKVKKSRSYESVVDNNRAKKKVEYRSYTDDMLLYFSYLKRKIRLIILSFQAIRRNDNNAVISNYSEMIELDTFVKDEVLQYQGGTSAFIPKVNKEDNIVRNFLRKSNRPLCCNECNRIVCVKCWKGRKCCSHYKLFMRWGIPIDSQGHALPGYEIPPRSNELELLTRALERDRAYFQGNVEQDIGGDSSVVQTDTANNVVLTETEITQKEVVGVKDKNLRWTKTVSSDVIDGVVALVTRWFRVGTFTWTTQMSRNTTITSIDLPRAAILAGLDSVNTCNQPNKIPFRIFRYWRGDMRVKIHINCNKFQIGQLQCSWYYQPKADGSFPSKSNVYTRSGTHHCIISAAPNNEVEFVIPYKAYKTMYHSKSNYNDNRDQPLDLGTLFITVLSPLKTAGETSPKCSFTVFIKFENTQFTGMIAGDIDPPLTAEEPPQFQMDTIGELAPLVVPLVEKVLESSSNDPNRDNPPVNNAPQYFVPTGSHSWSIGTDLPEPLHNLRLSGKAQTPHPDIEVDEMKVDCIKRKFMLQDIFKWSQQDINGRLLWQLPVNPLPPKDRLYTVTPATTNALASYQITPIGFLSSMYMYWRGSIEYRFDIVASQFHSGKLLLAYIPGVAENKEVTLEQARASPNIVISLDNAMTYTWVVPYVADRPWWPRRYSGESIANNSSSPSKIFVFVLNELVLADTVADDIEILVYMRGGEDMEFSIPVQPSIGIGYERNYVSSRNNTDVFPVSTTNTFYAGNWHSVSGVLVWRHAATSEAVARFSEPVLDKPAFYKLNINLPKARILNGQLIDINHCIFLRGVGFSEFIGVPIVYFDTINGKMRLEAIARAAFQNNYTAGTWMNEFIIQTSRPEENVATGFLPSSLVTTSNTYGGGRSIPWVATTLAVDLSELEFQGNREEYVMKITNSAKLQSTDNGSMTFGEKFVDLKDLTRRYQIYGWITVPKSQIERDPGACSFVFPVLPQGLLLEINTPNQVNQIWNRAREGHIPLIASLYRFYRGSVRIRIIVSNGNGLIMWVQHRPDRKLIRDDITLCTQVSTAEAVFNHTYGVYMQDLNVNSIVEIEVPFYQMANFGLLQKPIVLDATRLNDWANFYSLGELSIGFFGNQPSADVRCTIFYSLADDCRFSTYQGVPPIVLIDDLPEFETPLQYQGLKDYFVKNTKEIGEEVVSSTFEDVTSRVQPMIDEFVIGFQSRLSETYKSVKESLSELDLLSKLSHIGTQIIHAINNPTPSTIAISVGAILITLGIITYSCYSTIVKYVCQIWNYVKRKVCSEKVQEEASGPSDDLKFQSETDNAIAGFLSLVMGGLCTLFGISNAPKYKPISDSLFTGITSGMRVSNVCFTFFKNFMTILVDMKTIIVNKLYPGFNAAESLMQGKDIIEKWVYYSQEIIDPYVAKDLHYDKKLQCRLLDCYAFGKILKVKALETQYPAMIQLINTTFDKLHKLHVELVASGQDPHVRKMPFVIYNYGPPEIGKSHLTTNLVSELCASQDIKSETDLMCVLNATSKFWDHCDRQVGLVMDDAFNIRKGAMLEDQIAAIFNIVSPVVLVPPKAAVEDKGRRYNPEIFVMNSNIDFFRTELCVEEALWRRRDVLIKTELDPDYVKDGCVHCEQKLKVNSALPADAIAQLKDFHHLKFKYTFDVKNPQCIYQPENSYLKYPELLNLLKKLFKENREAENIKFADRVEQCNKVVGTRESLVSNVDNLEQLWNDAIRRRELNAELIKNSTFKSICGAFKHKITDKWEELKHQTLKTVYNAFKPGNNKYFLLNETCNECVRIKYQCIECKMKLDSWIKEQPEVASSSSSIDVLDVSKDDKIGFQGNIGVTEFTHDVLEHVNERCKEKIKEFHTIYPLELLGEFADFLTENLSHMIVDLRKYPMYARDFNLFKKLCEQGCKCIHNYRENIPILNENKFCFINPQSPQCPDFISDLCCRDKCWLRLPWIFHETAIKCSQISNIREDWMIPLVNRRPVLCKITFNSIFSKMTQWVFEFYYKCMKPAAKVVYSYLTSFGGWIVGLTFLSLLFSTTIMGVGCYEVCKESVQGKAVVQQQASISHLVNNNCSKNNMLAAGPAYQSQAYDAGKTKLVKPKKPNVKQPVKVTKKLEYQSQQFNIVENRINNNMACIAAVFDDSGVTRIVKNYGIMLRDHQMLIQRHYYDYWKRLDIGTKFYFSAESVKANNDLGILVNDLLDLDIAWFSSSDGECYDSNFGILYLPKYVPTFKDITKFIAKASEHEYIKFDDCYLYSTLTKRSMHCNMNLEFNKQVTDSNGWLRLDQCYSYRYTSVGLCGSVLLCSSLERPIIGIHFAGTNFTGYAEPITADSFIEFPIRHYEYETHEMRLSDDEPKIEFDTVLYPQGTIDKVYAHHQGSISQYIPSLVHGVYEVDSEPNPLSAKDNRLPPNSPPLKLGVEHMGKPPKDFKTKTLNAAAEDLANVVLNVVKPIRASVGKLTLQDAICGNVNVPGFEPLEWNSSEGFPLKRLRPPNVKGKKWLFDLEETPEGFKLKGMHGELKRQLYVAECMRKKGIRVPTLFTDCLKDTCIDVEKCKIPGKTRIFSISPVQYTIAFKQYFNDFIASYQAARIKSEHAIGINVDSIEWTQVANYLTAHGKNIIAGDYKNYGPSLMLKCVEKAFDIIMQWYERYDDCVENNLIRRVLLSELINAHHLCLNVIYIPPCGIPSGSPITTPLNSLVNSLYLRCAWLEITKQPFSIMHDNINILTYGDDVCINVSDSFKDIFNTISLNFFFKEYDIVFTDFDKSDNLVPYRTLETVSFLKRSFIKHPYSNAFFLAKIDEQSIRKCANWITRKGDPILNTLENCKQACELAFGHGPQYYNTVRERLQHECVKKLGVSFLAPSWCEKSEVCYNI